LRALLADYPSLVDWTLMDDTPTANAETRSWLNADVLAGGSAPGVHAGAALEAYAPRRVEAPEGEPGAPDVFELAMTEARSGRKREAIEMLSKEIAQERSGRARFQRKLELSQVCLAVGFDSIAQSILEELAGEIERRKLEEWESPEVVAHPLALLYRAMAKSDGSAELRHKLYAHICRLDPMQALAVSK
jgi:type VI secretion system protein ImpA